jgi:hypothetical protein
LEEFCGTIKYGQPDGTRDANSVDLSKQFWWLMLASIRFSASRSKLARTT